ncbi:MFS transporter [Amycolatopsis azurea DSM 43854]|uniref:MFS transporter n=1 Tax=Amycolatopsis azurea DSM 43854 TaxID=1238180 RepID=A0ABX3JKN5_9PSEU|nr:MFS transporter [Amycolatopsis azurea DSM 43854]
MLRDGGFVRLWTGTTASGLATWALPFVLGLAVLHGDLGPVGLGVVLATRTVGFIAAVPIAGVLADRHSRRGVVLWSGLLATAAMPVIAFGLGRSVVMMAIAAAVAGAGQGACRPAFQALTAEVVEEGQRQQANAATSLSVRVTTLVAPGLTTLLGAFMSVHVLLFGVAALWLVAAVVPPRGKASGPAPETARAGFLAEFMEGVREARRHPWFIAGLIALTSMLAFGYSASMVVLPMVSRDRYGTEVVLAAATTGYAVGALIGAVLIARWRPRAQGWAALVSLACYGFAPLCLLFPLHPAMVVAAYVIAGLGVELFNVPWFTATQREVAPDKLARVSSLDFLLSYGLAPAGLALIAPAIESFGATPVLAVCAVSCFVVPVLACLVPTSRGFTKKPSAAD